MNLHADLVTEGPHEEHADALMLFGQFVGSWSVDSTYHLVDGRRRDEQRLWHFAWVLGGRAVQDLICPVGAPPDQYGTTLRSYDPEIDAWHVVWVRPGDDQFAVLTGRAEGQGIVQNGRDGADAFRWTFTDITAGSFLWQGYNSSDGGASWRLGQVMRARRLR